MFYVVKENQSRSKRAKNGRINDPMESHERTNQRKNAQATNEQANERASERANERTK